MTTSTLISDYIGYGTHAARPASPNVPSGASAYYYETDTTHAFLWTGSAWLQITGSMSSSYSVVQSAANAGSAITGVTFSTAPTQNNLLVAISGGVSTGAGTGWTKGALQDNGGTTYTSIYWKLAGLGESTTQAIFSSTQNAGLVAFELSAGAGWTELASFSDGSATSHTVTPPGLSTSGLILGAIFAEAATTYPNTVPGTQDAQASDATANKSITGYHIAAVVGTNSLTAGFAVSTNFRLSGYYCG